MRLIGNIIWFILGGFLLGLSYIIGGLILGLTIIGIPFGVQIIKLGFFAMWPFGGEVVQKQNFVTALPVIMNILWIILGGLYIATLHLVLGVIFCITIIGIPFGKQHFKLMSLAALPFGVKIVRK